LLVALLVGAVGVAAYAGSVFATPSSGFSAVQQWKGVFGEIDVKTNDVSGHQARVKTHGVSDVYITRNAIAPRTDVTPGGQSGWHTHPGPSVVIVAEGEVTVYDSDDPACAPTVYSKGEGFIDRGDGHAHLVRNETTAPAEVVAFQIVPRDAVRRIDVSPAPGSCPS
jgi:quercetin dioxygenase-like cupin family protein